MTLISFVVLVLCFRTIYGSIDARGTRGGRGARVGDNIASIGGGDEPSVEQQSSGVNVAV